MTRLELLQDWDQCELSITRSVLKNLRKPYAVTMITDWAHIKTELKYSGCIEDLMTCLLRIYYWSDLVDGSLDHWSKQIYQFYNDIPRQKARKKQFPLKNKIHDAIWERYEEEDAKNYNLNRCEVTLPGYNELPDVIVKQEALDFCEKYIWWLSDRLSTNGKVEEVEVISIINKLMKER